MVAGARAQFKGKGILDVGGDVEEVGFFIVAIDSDLSVAEEEDRFRIKLWELETGNDDVLYDNQPGEDDDSDAATSLTSGKVVIKKQ